jgi:hypothetical protein
MRLFCLDRSLNLWNNRLNMTVKMSVSYFSKFLTNYFVSKFVNDFSYSFLAMSVTPRLISEKFVFKAFTASAFTDYLVPHVCWTLRHHSSSGAKIAYYVSAWDADRNTRRFCINWEKKIQFFHKILLRNSQQVLMNECNKVRVQIWLWYSRSLVVSESLETFLPYVQQCRNS